MSQVRVGFRATAGVLLKIENLEGFILPRPARNKSGGLRQQRGAGMGKARSREMGIHMTAGGSGIAHASMEATPLRKLTKTEYLGPSISLRIEGCSAANIKPTNPAKDPNAASQMTSFQERQRAAARASHLRGKHKVGRPVNPPFSFKFFVFCFGRLRVP